MADMKYGASELSGSEFMCVLKVTEKRNGTADDGRYGDWEDGAAAVSYDDEDDWSELDNEIKNGGWEDGAAALN